MTCRCHLCEPWNILAEECADEERLNSLTADRLRVHGLTPVERDAAGLKPSVQEPTKPVILMRRHVEERGYRMVVRDETFNLANPADRERLQKMIFDARQADIEAVIDADIRKSEPTWHEKTEPYEQPFRLHDYSTPFFRAVLKDQEQQRLREYLRSRL